MIKESLPHKNGTVLFSQILHKAHYANPNATNRVWCGLKIKITQCLQWVVMSQSIMRALHFEILSVLIIAT